jgi:endonuclease/exonuclease/phosphatase (EEP) superfamily protein YafD
VVFATVTALLRLAGQSGQSYLTLMLALLPLSMLACYPLAAAAGVTRRRGLATIASVLAIAHLIFIWPSLGPAPDVSTVARGAPTLTMLSFNTAGDDVDAAALGRFIARERPDVLILLELSERTADALDATGLAASYPHRIVEPSGNPLDGAGLYSRIPLDHEGLLKTVTGRMPGATVQVGGVSVRIQAVHIAPPLGQLVGRWQAEHVSLAKLARDLRQPLVLAGDFNSGRQHKEWRSLIDEHMTDAHEARGRGIVRTWPDNRAFLPNLLDLDHVLVSPGLVVLDIVERPGLGSDHRAVLTDIAVVSSGSTARR